MGMFSNYRIQYEQGVQIYFEFDGETYMYKWLTVITSIGGLCYMPYEIASAADVKNSNAETGTYSIVFENDLLGHPNSDRDYTMGMSLTRTNDNSTEYREIMSPWQKSYLDILDKLGSYSSRPDSEHSVDAGSKVWWQFGDTAFTPKDLTNPNPIYDDRPYANLVYLSAGYYTDKRNSSLYIGLLGTSIGDVVQTDIHRVCCSNDLPQGWQYQIGNVTPTFLYQEKFIHRFNSANSENIIDPDNTQGNRSIDGFAGFSVGYYTRAIAGLSAAYGSTQLDHNRLRTENNAHIEPYALPLPVKDLQLDGVKKQTNNVIPLPEETIQATKNTTGFGAWINYEVSLFGYNELLEGTGISSDPVKFNYSQMYPVVQLLTVGLNLTFIPKFFGANARDWDLYYALNWKSKEIRTDMEPPYHSWGTLNLSWNVN